MSAKYFLGFVSVLALAACAGASEGDPGPAAEADQTGALTMTCNTPARVREDASQTPRFQLNANVAATYRTGAELTEITNSRANAGRPGAADQVQASLAKDAAYKPRGANKNLNRFNLPALDASDESFDGIVHSIILPRNLVPADITSNDGGKIAFDALLASSTDSYHDGIISYFKLKCELSPGNALSNGADYLSCASRQPSDDDYGPSFSVTASVDAKVLQGAELAKLDRLSASAAQAAPTQIASSAKDPAYAPRTNKNRNRFDLPAMDATDDNFDGIAHGLILPKTLEAGKKTFTGYLISSTDSYHDGIMSYFPMDCRLTP